MEMIDITEAKARFSRLLKRVAEGEEIVIARRGKPVARLVACNREPFIRKGGQWEGKVWISEDFDDPLPEEVMKYFRGEGD